MKKLTTKQRAECLRLLGRYNWLLKVRIAHVSLLNTEEGTAANEQAWQELMDVVFEPVEAFDHDGMMPPADDFEVTDFMDGN